MAGNINHNHHGRNGEHHRGTVNGHASSLSRRADQKPDTASPQVAGHSKPKLKLVLKPEFRQELNPKPKARLPRHPIPDKADDDGSLRGGARDHVRADPPAAAKPNGLIGGASRPSEPGYLAQLDEVCRQIREPQDLPRSLEKLGQGYGVYVPAWYRRICKSYDQAAVLAQIIYWYCPAKGQKRLRHKRRFGDGPVLAASFKDLGHPIGLSARQVKEFVKQLCERGYISKGRGYHYGRTITHYLVNVKAVAKAIFSKLAVDQPDGPMDENCPDQ